MTFKNIGVQKEKDLARIIINRSPLNVLDIATLGEVHRAFAALEKEKPLLVVFSGAGENFSAGLR
ncbi:MAG: hypothetical protein L0Z48_03265 [candidate division Zixibacteria bacterium]|nr:hypothetical protein [candidate division Zixibacteria bacterium]